MKTVWVVLFLGCCITPNLTRAQQTNPNGKATLPKLNFEGRLQAWQGGTMRILSTDGKAITFALPQSPKDIRFTASLEVAALKRGMLVRLLGHVGEDGEFKNPIGKFEVFVPEQPNSDSNTNPAYRNNNVPGIYALKDYRPPLPADRATDEVRIIGHFLELKNETLSLQCGNIVKKVDVKEEPSIELNIRTLEYAQPGDTVTGTITTAAGTNQLIALNVSVFAAKPLAGPPAAPAKGPSVPKLRVKEKSK